jgi:peptidoglycan/xylan/chitin deacetylase (PgdA/CDA1 family)
MNGKWLIFIFFLPAYLLFSGCQTINGTRAELAMPQKIVLFTFDDGPNAYNDTSNKLLDVLKKYNVKALFALLGENVERNPDIVARIYNDGHYIINHGYSDKWACFMTDAEFKNNLEKGEQAIVNALGVMPTPLLYRPQGGYYRTSQIAIWTAKGYALVKTTARPYDAVLSLKDKNKVINKVITKINAENGGIILLHDANNSALTMETQILKNPNGPFNREWIPSTVEEIILWLKDKGFMINGFDIAKILAPRESEDGYNAMQSEASPSH